MSVLPSEEKEAAPSKQLTFGQAVVCLLLLISMMIPGFVILRIDTRVVFALAALLPGTALVFFGFKKEEVLGWFIGGVANCAGLLMILMSVGIIIGTWIASGVVPTFIYYGLTFLSPTTYLIVAFLTTCLVSFFIGSSFSTLATMGVAFMGIGMGLGINPAISGGMALSGALFGDKLSPFSDTTHIAAAVSGVNVYRHINSMLYTTGPAFIITCVLYIAHGMAAQQADMTIAIELMDAIRNNFNVTPVLFLVPVVTIVLIMLKLPPVLALVGSSIVAVIIGGIVQAGTIPFAIIVNSAGGGFSAQTGNPYLNTIVNRGGMIGMATVLIWTMIIMGIGDMMRRSGVINIFLSKILGKLKTPRHMALSTLAFSFVTACATASQYLSLTIPGLLLKGEYDSRKISRLVMSRSLEGGGTMFSFLIPWDSAALFASAAIGVATLAYAPYAYLLWITPAFVVLYALINKFMWMDEEGMDKVENEQLYLQQKKAKR